MKKVKFYSWVLLVGILFLFLLPSIKAATPDYVGVEVGDEYIWEFEFDEAVYNKSVSEGIETDLFGYFDEVKGLRFTVESIYPEKFMDGCIGVPVEIISYITYSEINASEWIFLRVYTNYLIVNPIDMNIISESINLWITPLVPRNLNWSLVADSIQVTNASAWMIEGWSRGLIGILYWNGTDIPLRIFNEYTADGVLSYSMAYYGLELISTVSIYKESYAGGSQQGISGFPIIGFSVIMFLSIALIIAGKRVRS